MSNEYETQAQEFLARHDLRFRATLQGDKCPPWCGEDGKGCCHGTRYRATISRKGGGRLSFDYWNSHHDMLAGQSPTPYDVLTCISSDAYSPDTFEEWCDEFGYDEDSRKSFALFNRCNKFARRLRAFFTEAELEELADIR